MKGVLFLSTEVLERDVWSLVVTSFKLAGRELGSCRFLLL